MKDYERRKRKRLKQKYTIRHSSYQVLGTPVFQETTTVDLSLGGLSFLTAHEYKKGALVLLELELEEEVTRLLVCVAWVKKTDGLYLIGTELIAIDPVHQEILQNTVHKLIRKNAPVAKKTKVSIKKKVQKSKKKTQKSKKKKQKKNK